MEKIISENKDGQSELVNKWRKAAGEFKPFAQVLSIDLSSNPNEAPKPVQGGFRSGYRFLIDYLRTYQDAGVNHVIFTLKHGTRPAEEVIEELGKYVIPHFPANRLQRK